ncbi:hypothetical protein P3T37_006115 [Kitasatospora sp. MAA4]|uniref:hypothetical protein n=1 Tax=Kitasatospora sp. MAA4 TaxID=3035093 RepID=UPI0024742240|nr:hypothetical protein [Kitasatospora sp. MAA4]MDH6136684.1 hypothetical protein [Kitasatospora sp. MAA4]
MRFTTTARRTAAVALAAATLGLGATTSAQAVTIGGPTTITNGSCSVAVYDTNGLLSVQALGDNGGCYFGVRDSTGGSWLVLGPAPVNPHGVWVLLLNVAPGTKLSGCLISDLTGATVCDPLN